MQDMTSTNKLPKILDNKFNGSVYTELKESLKKDSKLSVISAYFTIYAFEELKKELLKIDNMRFIYTEPSFSKKDEDLIRQYYISRVANEKSLSGNEFEIKLRNELNQASISAISWRAKLTP